MILALTFLVASNIATVPDTYRSYKQQDELHDPTQCVEMASRMDEQQFWKSVRLGVNLCMTGCALSGFIMGCGTFMLVNWVAGAIMMGVAFPGLLFFTGTSMWQIYSGAIEPTGDEVYQECMKEVRHNRNSEQGPIRY